MSKQLHKLTAVQVRQATKPALYNDGGGLYLVVGKGSAKSWIFRYRDRNTGKLRDMGIGSVVTTSLALAREKATQARALLKDGQDPIVKTKSVHPSKTSCPTFSQVIDEILPQLEKGWRNPKHRAQWHSTLRTYAAPIAAESVNEIDTTDVLNILSPIWTTKPETASRVRGRIEKILDAAKAKGYRSGENPARWRGHLDNLLAKRKKLTRGHHAALPFANAPKFMEDLAQRSGVAALALEFTILTAARSGESREAVWSEIDLANQIWVIPPQRMKAQREHRVPLTPRAVAIVEQMAQTRFNDLVFPGMKQNKPLSDMTLSAVIKRMQLADVTVHGFRSTFKDWATETTEFPNELSEMALAHVVGSEVERAYRRGDALQRRRTLMQAWHDYLLKTPS